MTRNFTISRYPWIALALLACAAPPAMAQQAPGWRPVPESIIVTAAPHRDLRQILTGTNIQVAIALSASIPVPYSDLNLTQGAGADEFGRRIHVAARLVCRQIDAKYPPGKHIRLTSAQDCIDGAAKEGMEQANLAIARARR